MTAADWTFIPRLGIHVDPYLLAVHNVGVYRAREAYHRDPFAASRLMRICSHCRQWRHGRCGPKWCACEHISHERNAA